MVTLASERLLEGIIISTVVLLGLSSLSLADTWDPIADADF